MSSLKQSLRDTGLSKAVGLYRFLCEEVRFAAGSRLAPRRLMDQSHRDRSWDFDSEYGKAWHAHVIELLTATLGTDSWGDVLEIGCSEGAFTSLLAPRCLTVQAYDISPIALARATQRCTGHSNVRIHLGNVAEDDVPGTYDLVFAMDVLSCIRGRSRLAEAVDRLIATLRDGGTLIYSDNSMPLEVLRAWGYRRWWARMLGVVKPEDFVGVLEKQYGLQLLFQEQYIPDPKGGRDQLIAFLRKRPKTAG